MAAAYYRVTFPNGNTYIHGGNKSEIRESISIMMEKKFPLRTTVSFYFGKNLRGTIYFGKKRPQWKRR
jgi:hypothetical protein